MNTITSKKNLIISGLGLTFLAILSGCSGKGAPDEYMVLRQAALSTPPEYHLTPNGPDEDLNDVIDPQEIAKRALFGEK